ncbi:MAG: hydrogenase maturation protease [Cyclobacteriaceae bacterium]
MKKSDMPTKILLIGIGNSSRGDDALGWRIADNVTQVSGIHVEYRYQLQIEDADLIKDYDVVVFADATREIIPDGFTFLPVDATGNIAFSTHRLSPSAVLSLCQEIYGRHPEAFTLALTGTYWELGLGISPEGTTALSNANQFLSAWIKKGPSQISRQPLTN